METTVILALFDHMYWVNRRLLAAAGEVPVHQFVAPSSITTRNLRGTLLHELDVEWSWRQRLMGAPEEQSEAALPDEDFPDAAALGQRWAADEEEMRTWLGSIDEEALAALHGPDRGARYPLWFYLLHIITHASQQQADAAVLLTGFGHSPGELDFLDYADSLPPQA